jgi:hyperosmotically inducible periplasmic protein
MKRLLGMALVSILAVVLPLPAQTPKTQTGAPDNTSVNKRDRNSPTADQQKQNASDVDITRQIRRSITGDKSLSTYAKNIKVITQNGNVTLRGPVRSDEEKKSIEAKANDVAGAGHVKSEIQIAAQQNTKKNR